MACDDVEMPSPSAGERAALVNALRVAGPDAPTLCAGWTTHDLAAHLVARERRPDSGPGILLPAFEGWTERVRRGYTRRSFAQLLHKIETGPPRTSPFALPGVDAAVNLAEHFVHCEDVRRAVDGWRPRELPTDRSQALWRLVATRGRMLFRRAPRGILLAAPDGRQARVSAGDAGLTITGEPGELLLYAFGRRECALVALAGPLLAQDRLRAARFEV
jgi:uncharacterized protein (TIGR03085 family)